MKRSLNILGIALAALSAVYFFGGIRLSDTSLTGVTVSQGAVFSVPKGVNRLALLGCTPHPTNYLEKVATPRKMADLTLADLIDLHDLEDSFRQILHLCVTHKVDHLLIAYLPIYFVKMRQLTGPQFLEASNTFLTTIAPQVKAFIETIARKEGITVPITLVVPPRTVLEKVPCTIGSGESRVRYLIKQFPHLVLNDTKPILIINNKGSDQNEGIIRYLQYEYLFDNPLTYEVCETDKKRFHKYLH